MILEIEPPSIKCGDCRFTSAMAGVWSVEGGRLVFRADADPQPRRGPDLVGCCESDRDSGETTGVEVTDSSDEGGWTSRRLSDEEFRLLRVEAMG